MQTEARRSNARVAAALGALLAATVAFAAPTGAAAAPTDPPPDLEKGPGKCSDALHVGGRTVTIRASDVGEQPMNLERLGLRSGEYVLTYDDGPTWITEVIVNTLARHCAKATFFMIGSRAEKNGHMVWKQVVAGHQLANHTQDSPELTKVTVDEAVAQIIDGRNTIRAMAGDAQWVLLLRPPAFRINAEIRDAVAQLGLVEIGPDISPKDWRGDEAEAVMDRLLDELDRRDRGVILLHDNQPNTPKLTEMLMNHFVQTGRKIVNLKVVP